MPLLWRISNHAGLSGEGGLRYSARWHTAGLPVVYLAASPAGAMIEILVHLELNEDNIPLHYQLLEVAVPDDLVIEDLHPETRLHQAEWKLDVNLHALTRRWMAPRQHCSRRKSAVCHSAGDMELPAEPAASSYG